VSDPGLWIWVALIAFTLGCLAFLGGSLCFLAIGITNLTHTLRTRHRPKEDR